MIKIGTAVELCWDNAVYINNTYSIERIGKCQKNRSGLLD